MIELYPSYKELYNQNPIFARKEEGLKDLLKRPKNSPNKTPPHIEAIILRERKKTGYGRDRK